MEDKALEDKIQELSKITPSQLEIRKDFCLEDVCYLLTFYLLVSRTMTSAKMSIIMSLQVVPLIF